MVNLAADIGIDRDVVLEFIQSDAGNSQVRDLEQKAFLIGIRGVPSIRIGDEILSGAQLVEVYLTTLQKAVNELTEV